MANLAAMSDADLKRRIRRLRVEQLRRDGKAHVCAQCGSNFHARRGASYCSVRCRVAACRDRARASEPAGRRDAR